jgi:CMP-N-acetylneuraminic acid synthetase
MKTAKLFECDPLSYDNEKMSPEERVLTVVDWLVDRKEQALSRLKNRGLPAVALWDWFMDCTKVAQDYYSNPLNRDCNKQSADWNIIAIIPARGGSKGVPGKSLRDLKGKTALQHAIETCRGIRHLKRIIVNTDSPEIAKHAEKFGAEVPYLRPKQLAGDDSSLEEAIMFSRYWLNLVEKQCYDVLVVVSAVTPLLDTQEINRALKRLIRRNVPSLQATVELPSCSLDYLYIDADGLLGPFCEEPPVKFKSYSAQCGAFSLHCFRPYYQIQPWFRPYVYELSPPPPAPLAHMLPVHQGLEIDELWDLDACRMLLHEDDSVCLCRQQDLQVTPGHFPLRNKFPQETLCMIYLPSRNQCLEIGGLPSFLRVVNAARKANVGPVLLWGDDKEWECNGDLHGCVFLSIPSDQIPEDVRYAGGIARMDVAEMLREQPLLRRDFPLLILDGRAGMLQEASISAVMAKAKACPFDTIVSVSPSLVHPFYLKHVLEDGTLAPAIGGNASMRQNLPEVHSRDGVLCLSPSEKSSGQRGVYIPLFEGWVLRDVYDGARAFALARHSNKKGASE